MVAVNHMSDGDIVADNIRATGAIYFAQALEEMRAFDVVERLVEMFQRGMLTLGRGVAVDRLRRYAFDGDRLTKQERASLYARALGTPGASGDVQPNREFADLWLRFISSVASQERPEAARALAVNASAHGGALVFAAARLHADVQAMLEILRDPEIERAIGARDMWQVIDEVNSRDLGGAVSVKRYRDLAQSANTIFDWLAKHATALSHCEAIASDAKLRHAVEAWLAARG